MSELTEKDKLESLEALRRGAYDSFNDRRSYEWKFALAIWTALAVIIAGLLQPIRDGDRFPLNGTAYGIAATVVGCLILWLHIYFTYGTARANMIDRTKVRNYSDHIEEKLGLIPTVLQNEIDERIKRLPKYPRGDLVAMGPPGPDWVDAFADYRCSRDMLGTRNSTSIGGLLRRFRWFSFHLHTPLRND